MLDQWIMNIYSNYNNYKDWEFSMNGMVRFYNVTNTAQNMRLYHFLYE